MKKISHAITIFVFFLCAVIFWTFVMSSNLSAIKEESGTLQFKTTEKKVEQPVKKKTTQKKKTVNKNEKKKQ